MNEKDMHTGRYKKIIQESELFAGKWDLFIWLIYASVATFFVVVDGDWSSKVFLVITLALVSISIWQICKNKKS